MKKRFIKLFNLIRNGFHNRPVMSFLGFLTLLLLIIATGSFLRSPETVEEDTVVLKQVETFSPVTNPSVTVQGKVDDTGTVTIVAQTSGIITNINVFAGEQIYAGRNVVTISNNYQGGNAASVQRQIVQKQYDNIVETYDTQVDLITHQKTVAEKLDENTDQLRNIANDSIDETKDLIQQNEEILNELNNSIAFLESSNGDGSNSEDIMGLKQASSQVTAGVLQLRGGLRQAEYQASSENPPAQLADVQREMTVKQLELQEKGLSLQKEITKLQLTAAYIGESIFYPVSPISGTVEKIHITPNTMVNPGAQLVTLKGYTEKAQISAFLPGALAQFVSMDENSEITIDQNLYTVKPAYVSQVPTQGLLHSISFLLDENISGQVSQGSYVRISIPLFGNCEDVVCFVPIDAVHQTQSVDTVYILEDGKVVKRTITVGDIIGAFVRVASGIDPTDTVIITRNVVDGDSVVVAD
ncbi:hypothetical protein ACFL1P_01385 [Patescibacteria group bacterium]